MTSTPVRGRFGFTMRGVRAARGIAGRDVAKAVGVSSSLISLMERGERKVTPENAERWLAFFGFEGAEYAAYFAMATGAPIATYLSGADFEIPETTAALATYECLASKLTDWALTCIPGLLQTPDYARGLLAAVGLSGSIVSARMHIRSLRQDHLLGTVPYTALIDEQALRRGFGGPRILANQLRHLREVCEEGRASVRVVPANAERHYGLANSFLMVEFAHEKPVVHIEVAGVPPFLGEREQVNPYMERLGGLMRHSLDEADSLELIMHVEGEARKAVQAGRGNGKFVGRDVLRIGSHG